MDIDVTRSDGFRVLGELVGEALEAVVYGLLLFVIGLVASVIASGVFAIVIAIGLSVTV